MPPNKNVKAKILANPAEQGSGCMDYYKKIALLAGSTPLYVQKIYTQMVRAGEAQTLTHSRKFKKPEVVAGNKEPDKHHPFKKKEKTFHNTKQESVKEQAYTKTEGENSIVVSGKFADIDDLIKRCNIDTTIWECYDFKIVDGEWDVSSKYRDQDLTFEDGVMTGHAIRKNEWTVNKNKKKSIEAKFRLIPTIIYKDKFREELLEDFKKLQHTEPYLFNINSNKECFALEICRFDMHIGKMIWGNETGGDNYDNKIATRLYAESGEYLLSEAQKICQIDKILLPIGNDFFNSDNNMPYPATTKGTPQQDDMRWQKTFRMGRVIVADDIVKCTKVAPVDIKNIPGNHDFQKSFYLGDALECFFYNNDNVNIDNSPNPHKYWAYGNTLIGFIHDTKSLGRLGTLMQNDIPEQWAISKYREWHLGNIHHGKKLEIMTEEDKQTITIRYLRTLMPTDNWENEEIYRSNKGAHAFIWSKTKGLYAELQFNL